MAAHLLLRNSSGLWGSTRFWGLGAVVAAIRVFYELDAARDWLELPTPSEG